MENRGLDINFMQGARDILNARQMAVNNANEEEKMRLLGEKNAVDAYYAARKDARDTEAAQLSGAKTMQEVKAQQAEYLGRAALAVKDTAPGSPERAEAEANFRAFTKFIGVPIDEDEPITNHYLDTAINLSKEAGDRLRDRQATVQVPVDDKGTVETRQAGPRRAYDVVLGKGKKGGDEGGGAPAKMQQTTYQATNGEPIVFDPGTRTYYRGVSMTPATADDFKPKLTNPGQGERDKLADLYTLQQQADSIEQIVAANPRYVGVGQNTLGGITQMFSDEEAAFRAQVENMKDSLLRMRSGAAITESEYQRLSSFVPNLNALTSETEFKGKLKQFKTELARAIDSKKQAMGEAGVVVRDQAAAARDAVPAAKTKPKFKIISVK